MKTVEMFYWRIASDTVPGKRITTKYLMTREEAVARDPEAVPVGQAVPRVVYEEGDEVPAMWPVDRKP